MEALRKQIEQELNKLDPIGGKVRKLKRRIISLEKKRKLTTAEYREVADGWLKIKALEQQRKEFNSLQSSIDPKLGRRLKLAKQFDNICERYDSGTVDEDIYAMTLEKVSAHLRPVQLVHVTRMPLHNRLPHGILGAAVGGLEQLVAAVIIFIIVIPALFACSHG
jgi:hypothetical protein